MKGGKKMTKKRKKRVSKKVNHGKPPEVTPTVSPPGETEVTSSTAIASDLEQSTPTEAMLTDKDGNISVGMDSIHDNLIIDETPTESPPGEVVITKEELIEEAEKIDQEQKETPVEEEITGDGTGEALPPVKDEITGILTDKDGNIFVGPDSIHDNIIIDEPRPCDQYQIIHLFSYGKYLYNVGEPVPNVGQSQLDKLFDAGRIAKLVDGRVVRHVKEVHYSDSRINMISGQDISVIRSFVTNQQVPLADIKKLLAYCVQDGREPYILEIIGTEIHEREPLPDEPF